MAKFLCGLLPLNSVAFTEMHQVLKKVVTIYLTILFTSNTSPANG